MNRRVGRILPFSIGCVLVAACSSSSPDDLFGGAAAAAGAGGNEVFLIDIPHHNPQWYSVIQMMGFTEQRTFTRMYYGNNEYPGMRANQFAIAGPEFG